MIETAKSLQIDLVSEFRKRALSMNSVDRDAATRRAGAAFEKLTLGFVQMIVGAIQSVEVAAPGGDGAGALACQADPITLAARVLERSARHRDHSDADLSVLDTELREVAPFDTAEQGRVISINTEETDAVKRVAGTLKERLES